MFQFRDATDDDFKIIAAFPQSREELFFMFPKGVFPLTADQLREAAAARELPTVITYLDEVVGYSNLYDVSVGSECWIGNVIISPKVRGIGAGTFLIHTMIQRAQQYFQMKSVHLVCHNVNTVALLFYDKLGFKPYDMKMIEDYKSDKIAGIKMKMELSSSKAKEYLKE